MRRSLLQKQPPRRRPGRGPAATTTYALDWLNGGACLTQNLTRLDFTTAQAVDINRAIEALICSWVKGFGFCFMVNDMRNDASIWHVFFLSGVGHFYTSRAATELNT